MYIFIFTYESNIEVNEMFPALILSNITSQLLKDFGVLFCIHKAFTPCSASLPQVCILGLGSRPIIYVDPFVFSFSLIVIFCYDSLL